MMPLGYFTASSTIARHTDATLTQKTDDVFDPIGERRSIQPIRERMAAALTKLPSPFRFCAT